jgi:hypothetical protein
MKESVTCVYIIMCTNQAQLIKETVVKEKREYHVWHHHHCQK